MSDVTLDEVISLIDQLDPIDRAKLVTGLKESELRNQINTEPVPEGDWLRERLLAAGFLVTDPIVLTEDELAVEPYSDDELDLIGEMPAGTRPSEELVSEDRGQY